MQKSTLHLKQYAHEFSDKQQTRIFVGTWNVNDQPVGRTTPVHLWLHADPLPPDIYAIGFQELDLSKEAFIWAETPREKEWEAACAASLHPKAKYVKLKLVRLVGIMLVVYVKAELFPFVKNVAAETVGTGIMRKIGNKGGVAIRMDVHSTSICFVNSHLAAHQDECQRRNQDYHEICSRILFNQFKPPKYIRDHSLVYWLGDLNYRIDNLDSDEIKDLIRDNLDDNLFKHDQLFIQMRSGRVFVDFREPKIHFRPTYKYDPGTSDWDTSEKNRPPAWCDRILYRGSATEPIIYRSHPKLVLSDHKPVSCLFTATIDKINKERYHQVLKRVMLEMDKFANDRMPQVELSTREIVFNDVELDVPYKSSLKIVNTGQVPAIFEFIQRKQDDSSYCASWLQISPFRDLVNPNFTATVEISLYAMKNDVGENNSPGKKLEDILVMKLVDGAHLFITVTAILKQPGLAASSNPFDEDKPLIEL